MGYTNLRDAGSAIAHRKDFDGNSMWGRRHPGALIRGYLPDSVDLPVDLRYVVGSYGTPIAWVDRDGFAHVPDTKYSGTTSRHQSICRRALQPDSDAQQIEDVLEIVDEIATQRAIESITRGIAA
jgi:hypothetical protein